MYDLQDDPVERFYLYVVREDERPPVLFLPIALSILSLFLVLTVGVLFPYRPPLVQHTVSVPAILLPLRTFRSTVAVQPTGIHTFPATRASGVLTITNGSILAQHFRAGMIFTAANGTEVVTTQAVDVPASNGVSFGVASVRAQAVTPGASGNLDSLAIDAVYGTSLYIKNTRPFTGGQDSYSVPVIQPQDIQHALAQARASLLQHTLTGLLARPCTEQVKGSATLTVTWACQFVRYQVRGQVLSARVQGHFVLVEVLTAAPRQIREAK